MSRRYTSFIRSLCLALIFSLGPLIVANYVLENFALQQAKQEARSIGERFITRSELTINEVVLELQSLETAGVVTCRRDHLDALREVVSKSAYMESIGIADASGKPMCLVPSRSLRGKPILTMLDDGAPLIGIGMTDQGYDSIKKAIISLRTPNGWRLFSEVSPLALNIEPGPEYLRGAVRTEVRLGPETIWATVGSLNLPEGESDTTIISQTSLSTWYPLVARVDINGYAALSLVGRLQIITAIVCATVAVLFLVIAVWYSWQPDNESEDEFVAAIKNNEFIPYYQPVIDIETGVLQGCEVLMRWRRENGEMVSPGQFMTYAETSGHIFEMTRRLMVQIIDEVGDLYEATPDLKISINLFAGHFKDRTIVEDVGELFQGSPIKLEQVVLEVTERQPLHDINAAKKIIAELQAMGVRIALDDVGTGHGGLAYLQKLGMDIVKIDKMFVDPLGQETSTARIADAIVELAENLGMGIIAEGVETYEQILHLRKLGVTAAQGYIFAAPLPGDAFLKFAEEHETGTRNIVAELDRNYEARQEEAQPAAAGS
ncbi:EAL domain-containing protein [Pseudovibrio exalbescens]|uniref:EAL domain-containing protein n=1 Tax=Pseudovibrio exalbescens TaxID=197461 RepID=UPI0023661E46|nr:EAL domain-containing protein [Pseudovibrio exalbescens]MDD7908878.1 EAL domain-containing protein [Pseudovibrio exalbescens]